MAPAVSCKGPFKTTKVEWHAVHSSQTPGSRLLLRTLSDFRPGSREVRDSLCFLLRPHRRWSFVVSLCISAIIHSKESFSLVMGMIQGREEWHKRLARMGSGNPCLTLRRLSHHSRLPALPTRPPALYNPAGNPPLKGCSSLSTGSSL